MNINQSQNVCPKLQKMTLNFGIRLIWMTNFPVHLKKSSSLETVQYPIVCIDVSQQPSIVPPVVVRLRASVASRQDRANSCQSLSSTSVLRSPNVTTVAAAIGEQYYIISSPCNSVLASFTLILYIYSICTKNALVTQVFCLPCILFVMIFAGCCPNTQFTILNR
jgi:hypothetical protein